MTQHATIGGNAPAGALQCAKVRWPASKGLRHGSVLQRPEGGCVLWQAAGSGVGNVGTRYARLARTGLRPAAVHVQKAVPTSLRSCATRWSNGYVVRILRA